jgi:hypothetical protein
MSNDARADLTVVHAEQKAEAVSVKDVRVTWRALAGPLFPLAN